MDQARIKDVTLVCHEDATLLISGHLEGMNVDGPLSSPPLGQAQSGISLTTHR